MTIDEAIKHLKYDLEIKRALTCNYSFERQLVGWLEELKAMRNLDKTNYSDGYQQGRTDVIDECIAELEEDYKRASENVKYPEYNYYCNGIEDCIDCLEQLKEKNNG